MFAIFLSSLTTIVMLLILPAVFILTLWKTKFASKLQWFIDMLATTVIILWLFQAGNWSWLSYYLRYLLLLMLVAAIFISWRKSRSLPFRAKYHFSQKFTIGVHALLLIIFGAYNMLVLSSYTTDEQAIELEFPLHNGTYYVGQGGDHVQMNYHHAYEPQKYALDILKLHPLGYRATGLTPKDLEKYEIYADELFSPCNGTVLEAVNDLPDLLPPATNPDQPAGNHVALRCEGVDAVIYLAHMQHGSLTVKAGDAVQVNQLMGRVGNSGNTSEPHLHIHAEKDGQGIPIKFDGSFLVRNSLVR